MDPRLDAIESRLDQLTATLAAVERRLSALEAGAGSPATAATWETEPPGAETLLSAVPEATTLLTLAGRALLALGGAFLIRAVTESQVLPPAVGIALGGAYAFLWVLLADRAAVAGQRGEAMVRGTLAAAIGAPLAWEAAARFHAVAPEVAVSGLALLAVALMAVAWRRDLQLLAWVGPLTAAGGCLALLLSTRAVVSVDAALLLLGGATVWLAYGRHGWRGPRCRSLPSLISESGSPSTSPPASAGRLLSIETCLCAVPGSSPSSSSLATWAVSPSTPWSAVGTSQPSRWSKAPPPS